MTPQETIQAFYAAIAKGDAPTALGLISTEKLAWTESEGFPYYSGTWTTIEQVRDNLFLKLATEWEAFSATPRHFVVNGEEVIALGAYTGLYKATAKSVNAGFAHHWRVENGRITQFTLYTDTLLFDRAIHPR